MHRGQGQPPWTWMEIVIADAYDCNYTKVLTTSTNLDVVIPNYCKITKVQNYREILEKFRVLV